MSNSVGVGLGGELFSMPAVYYEDIRSVNENFRTYGSLNGTAVGVLKFFLTLCLHSLSDLHPFPS
jgi:hypothetical protein